MDTAVAAEARAKAAYDTALFHAAAVAHHAQDRYGLLRQAGPAHSMEIALVLHGEAEQDVRSLNAQLPAYVRAMVLDGAVVNRKL